MTQPVRIQLTRQRKLQDYSRAVNGLGAVNCARPGPWGNPYKIGQHGDRQECVDMFREYAADPARTNDIRAHLKGFNLACWCKASQACHTDVLLKIANNETTTVENGTHGRQDKY